MPVTERSVLKGKPARLARGTRNYLQSLEKYPLHTRFPGRGTKTSSGSNERFSLLWVTILSLPSLIFALLYMFYVPGESASWSSMLDSGLAEAFALLGLLGATMTFVAFVLTMLASFQGGISSKARRIMWAMVTLSLAGWVYVWVSFSILVGLPPLIPY